MPSHRKGHAHRPEPYDSLYLGLPVHPLCPVPVPQNTAFWTTLAGIAGLILWQLCPAVRLLPHVIYFEWVICIITLLIVRLVDKTPIKMPELKN